MRLKDKVAIVTGSSRGIGRTIALHLGKEGAKIVINGRDGEQLAKTQLMLRQEGLEVVTFPGDVSNPSDCKQLAAFAEETFGKVDILVNNAGVGSRGFFEETTPEVFRNLLDVNILGSVLPTLEVLPLLKRSHGSVVFISSLAGLRGLPNRSSYSLTKMAQTAMAESLRVELAGTGVHVGIIYVGATKNDPEKRVIGAQGDLQALQPRQNFWVDSQDKVARTVTKVIGSRAFKTTVSLQGAAYFYLQRFLPGLVDFIFRRNLNLIKKMDH